MRPSGAAGLLYLHRSPIPAGAQVFVGPDDIFCGTLQGTVAAVLESGRYLVEGDCDSGWFVRRVRMPFEFGGSLGQMHDLDGRTGSLTGAGQGTFHVVEPNRFVLGLIHQQPDDDQLSQYVKQTVLSAATRTFSEGLSRGEWRLPDLVAADRAAGLAARVEITYRDLGVGPPGLAVTVVQLALSMTDGGGEPKVSSFGPGVQVMVQWSDGNRYIGFVQKNGPGQVLVLFAGGGQHWVPVEFINRPQG